MTGPGGAVNSGGAISVIPSVRTACDVAACRWHFASAVFLRRVAITAETSVALDAGRQFRLKTSHSRDCVISLGRTTKKRRINSGQLTLHRMDRSR
jgi:hypothetical protein